MANGRSCTGNERLHRLVQWLSGKSLGRLVDRQTIALLHIENRVAFQVATHPTGCGCILVGVRLLGVCGNLTSVDDCGATFPFAYLAALGQNLLVRHPCLRGVSTLQRGRPQQQDIHPFINLASMAARQNATCAAARPWA